MVTDQELSEFEDLDSSGDSTGPIAANISELQSQVVELRDKLNERDFWWSLGVVFLVDAWLFCQMSTGAGIVCLFAMQVVVLVILAKRKGIEEVGILENRLFGIFEKKKDDD